MSSVDQRAALAALIQERREDFASLSRLLGRNPAYIQQFIKRGVPRKLDERDRRTLAQYFGVDESRLGGPVGASSPSVGGGLIHVPRLEVGASAGHGAFNAEERPVSHIGFDDRWLRDLARSSPKDLSIIRVQGDSMSPTLSDGDDILVDRHDGAPSLRDGIYVLRREDMLNVKRISVSPVSRRVAIKSDNPAYPSWPDVDLADVDIIGRVVWVGRRLK